MLILGFDTSTEVTTIALASGKELIDELALTSNKTQTERLVPLIDMILCQAGVEIGEIEALAVGSGPGLFTSLRVGVTTAKTFAHALNVPIVSCSTLDVLASNLAFSDAGEEIEQKGQLICSVIDAKRGEVFAGLYKIAEGNISKVRSPKVVSPDVLFKEISSLKRPVVLLGNGVSAYQDLFETSLPETASLASTDLFYPRAGNLIRLAFPRFISGETEAVDKLVPIYIRKSDAEIHYERKKQR